ncbi:putative anthranilate synthase component I [Piedraia hortae CBS 480.64]|uniref:anthranilate synthase n=1 Tax=Piedraia hortae CBS 480.64 TaxID=1314780 RepID=A0A6A7BY41_9PEZI|nr:putative anthranilate synthase component I [Piedraia hortae CBS 480.64]
MSIRPSLDEVREIASGAHKDGCNLIPICASIPCDFLTPSAIYLKVTDGDNGHKSSFLFESAATSETIGRYSFIGCDPRKTLVSGPKHGFEGDPLPRLAEELSKYRVADVPFLRLPPLTGGAIGYVGYDCVRYFEPRTAKPLKDILELPESLFMLFDAIVAVDHFFQVATVITYLHIDQDLPTQYSSGTATITSLLTKLQSPSVPLPTQGPIQTGQHFTSNIGQAGYESHVKNLKSHIQKGDIIQAVPSQRISRPTNLHPFNIYRQLRTVNPSPYLFYINCTTFQIIGASPELLVKTSSSRKVVTHPIAGTVKRGRCPTEEAALSETLLSSVKDKAEHVMLVDLARNDVNRVCDPTSVQVDKLMVVQKFSHVQHLVSEVSGTLRDDKTRFAAFRSIFPAGTVSGAPKVRAMELIAELEGEKRGVYAGAVGYWGYDSQSGEGEMDTCIALRTMVVKGGKVYLQAGGGIVFDSDPTEEFMETVNKLAANVRCVELAEGRIW